MPSIFDEIIQEKTGEVPSEKNDIDEDGAEENDTKGINTILQMIKGKTDINISTDSLPEINISSPSSILNFGFIKPFILML